MEALPGWFSLRQKFVLLLPTSRVWPDSLPRHPANIPSTAHGSLDHLPRCSFEKKTRFATSCLNPNMDDEPDLEVHRLPHCLLGDHSPPAPTGGTRLNCGATLPCDYHSSHTLSLECLKSVLITPAGFQR